MQVTENAEHSKRGSSHESSEGGGAMGASHTGAGPRQRMGCDGPSCTNVRVPVGGGGADGFKISDDVEEERLDDALLATDDEDSSEEERLDDELDECEEDEELDDDRRFPGVGVGVGVGLGVGEGLGGLGMLGSIIVRRTRTGLVCVSAKQMCDEHRRTRPIMREHPRDIEISLFYQKIERKSRKSFFEISTPQLAAFP